MQGRVWKDRVCNGEGVQGEGVKPVLEPVFKQPSTLPTIHHSTFLEDANVQVAINKQTPRAITLTLRLTIQRKSGAIFVQ